MLDSFLSQLFCCTARVKDSEFSKSLAGLGVFPFSVGKATVFADISTESERLGLGVSRDGLTAGLVDKSRFFVLRLSVSTHCEEDDVVLVHEIPVAGGGLYPFVAVAEKFGPDAPRFMAFSRGRMFLTLPNMLEAESFEVPDDYGSITCTCAFPWRQPGQPVAVTGTDTGYILLWAGSGLLPNRIKTQSGMAVCSVCADSFFVYAGIKGTRKIEIFSISGGVFVDTIEVTHELFGNIGSSILRPVPRVVDRRPSSPHQSPKTAKPVGSLFVTNEAGTMLAHFNLELKQSVVEPAHSAPITQLLFGPFDNGPVISVSGSELAAWETGAFLRMNSRVEIPLVSAAVSPARDKPRLWIVGMNRDTHQVEVTPFGLRSGYEIKENRASCF